MSSDLRVVKLGENIGARIDGVRLGGGHRNRECHQ